MANCIINNHAQGGGGGFSAMDTAKVLVNFNETWANEYQWRHYTATEDCWVFISYLYPSPSTIGGINIDEVPLLTEEFTTAGTPGVLPLKKGQKISMASYSKLKYKVFGLKK